MFTCPQCASDRVASRDRGRKSIGILGAVVGAAWALACAVRSTQGASAGDATNPTGTLLGSIAGAALAEFVSGSAIGQAVDAGIGDHQCLACGFVGFAFAHAFIVRSTDL